MSKSRGEANFVWKCKTCKVGVYLPTIVFRLFRRKWVLYDWPLKSWNLPARIHSHHQSSSHGVHTLLATDTPTHHRIRLPWIGIHGIQGRRKSFSLSFDSMSDFSDPQVGSLTRPLTSRILKGEWKAKGLESSTKFSGVDLQEGEWFDYDEKAGEEVSIKDLKWEITRAWMPCTKIFL